MTIVACRKVPRLGSRHEQQQELDQALDQPPADGGMWTGPKVAAWMRERLGRDVDPRLGWDYLQRLGRSSRIA